MIMKERLFIMIEEKREAIKKLKTEYYVLLNAYHLLPIDEEILKKQKEEFEELIIFSEINQIPEEPY